METHTYEAEKELKEIGENENSERIFSVVKLGLSGVLLILTLVLNLSYTTVLVVDIFAAVVSGYGLIVKAFKNLLNREFFDENALMLIASVTAFVIGEAFEGVLIIILYELGELLEDIATDSSREKIAGLAELKCDRVNVVIDGKTKETEPENVPVGSIILIRKGERVPIDGVVFSGASDFDLKAVTGESKIYGVSEGGAVYSGAINLGSAITVKTTKLYKDSTVEKIISLVEESTERKAKSQKFITSFAKIYTPCVVLLAVLIALIPPLFDGYDFVKWIYKGLSFLIISCPCALVISVPLCFFLGIGSLAKRGILVKGSNYIDALAKTGIAVFDKTGTITTGNFTVENVKAYGGFTENEILKIAASIESKSTHPIAKALTDGYDGELYAIDNTKEISGKGVMAVISGDEYSVGNKSMVRDDLKTLTENGKNTVYVAKNGAIIGEIELCDTLKEESKYLVKELKNAGVLKSFMLSGDKKAVAERVANQIGLDGAYSELLPEQKTEILSDIIKEKGKRGVLYCGDGINDSPSIAMADVGVAMGALGSDAAIDSADVVISDDNLLKIPYAIKKSKLIKRKVVANIVVSILVKLVIMGLSVFTSVPLWLAMVGDVGVMLLAVLNSLTISLYK